MGKKAYRATHEPCCGRQERRRRDPNLTVQLIFGGDEIIDVTFRARPIQQTARGNVR